MKRLSLTEIVENRPWNFEQIREACIDRARLTKIEGDDLTIHIADGPVLACERCRVPSGMMIHRFSDGGWEIKFGSNWGSVTADGRVSDLKVLDECSDEEVSIILIGTWSGVPEAPQVDIYPVSHDPRSMMPGDWSALCGSCWRRHVASEPERHRVVAAEIRGQRRLL